MSSQSDDDFVKVAETKDIHISQMKEVQIDGEDVCIANVDGKYYAIGNVCTHEAKSNACYVCVNKRNV